MVQSGGEMKVIKKMFFLKKKKKKKRPKNQISPKNRQEMVCHKSRPKNGPSQKGATFAAVAVCEAGNSSS